MTLYDIGTTMANIQNLLFQAQDFGLLYHGEEYALDEASDNFEKAKRLLDEYGPKQDLSEIKALLKEAEFDVETVTRAYYERRIE